MGVFIRIFNILVDLVIYKTCEDEVECAFHPKCSFCRHFLWPGPGGTNIDFTMWFVWICPRPSRNECTPVVRLTWNTSHNNQSITSQSMRHYIWKWKVSIKLTCDHGVAPVCGDLSGVLLPGVQLRVGPHQCAGHPGLGWPQPLCHGAASRGRGPGLCPRGLSDLLPSPADLRPRGQTCAWPPLPGGGWRLWFSKCEHWLDINLYNSSLLIPGTIKTDWKHCQPLL